MADVLSASLLSDEPTAPTLASMPAEILEKIFALAIPEQVIMNDTRDISKALRFRPINCVWRLDGIYSVHKWTYELLNVSKRLRAIIGPILYTRIIITPGFFLSKRSSSHFSAASEMKHEPTRYSGKKVKPFSVCKTAKHGLDRKLREICGLPSACILEEEKEDVLSQVRAGADESSD
ncbi:uncharacterized protein AB675_7722 [Cyphellophora attinorum]|uniref:F-box domain-containing protein n=1 Tax=Cyphellophora attinorum TaxID=1664694 RepID=A0A0N1HBF1_9EURO|nr:uncharacterized protein AB675_7722 [Phialophora attinorum]KPI40604.1 hypothetical protein AB675_7722 [Phialophora attinorum]